MAEIKMISENRLKYVAGLKGFNLIYLEKDYFLTRILYLLKDVDGALGQNPPIPNSIHQ